MMKLRFTDGYGLSLQAFTKEESIVWYGSWATESVLLPKNNPRTVVGCLSTVTNPKSTIEEGL